VHGLIEGVSILVSIVIIVSVTSVNNWIKEKQFQELQRKQDCSQAVVIRAGITQTVSSEDLVVGDVVKIEPGKTIPADCLLIQSTDISVDESALTGESEQISKEAATEENYASNP
jgi:P-type E1-E2 ATPase